LQLEQLESIPYFLSCSLSLHPWQIDEFKEGGCASGNRALASPNETLTGLWG